MFLLTAAELCSHSIKVFSVFCAAPSRWSLGMHKGLPELWTLTDPKDIPDHVASCSAYRAGGRTREVCRETFGVVVFVSQVNVTCDGALLSWGCLNPCLPLGSGEWIPCSALLCFACVHVELYLLNCLSLNPHVVFTLSSPILSLIPLWRCNTRGRQASGSLGMKLLAGVKPQQFG